MDVEQFRTAGHRAIDQLCEFFNTMQDRPVVSQVEPGYLRDHVPCVSCSSVLDHLAELQSRAATAPTKGEEFHVIADDFQNYIVPGLTQWQHPSFFGYFPAACTFEGILGDLYSSSVTNPGFNWLSSPACTELESIVMDWAANLFGLDKIFLNSSDLGGGVIQTTAHDSLMAAMVGARSLYQRNHPGVKTENMIIYTTTQTHSLAEKAGLAFGIQVRKIGVNLENRLSLRGEALRNALEEDIHNGLHPFMLVATLGTTSSGANDNLSEIGEVAKNHPSLWVHVDAAWAGVALSCPELRKDLYLDDINAFVDSLCVNFHKWGLVNFDCSGLWVRDRNNLTEALDITPAYLRTKQGDSGNVIEYRNWHLSLGRRFRSLKVWFVLRSYGVEGFQNHIRKGVNLNKLFVGLIENSNDLQLVTEPSLALSVFRIVPKSRGHPLKSVNELNRIYQSRLSPRSDIMLVQTEINGIYCMRMAIGAQRTTGKHIRDAFNILEEEATNAIDIWGQKSTQHDG